jgi:hypothetical protein
MNRRDGKTLSHKTKIEEIFLFFGLCPSICGKALLFRTVFTLFLRLRRRSLLMRAAATPKRGTAVLLFSLCLCASVVNLSCGSKPTDMRSLVPADSLVYLETNDLAAALQPIIDSKPFNEVAKYKPDFSALKGVQLAVAVTGFEASEEKVNDEQSIGRIQPRFVAVADTHAWNFQAVGFAEQKLGSFVAKIYDSEPTLEKSDKYGGKYFTWTSQNNRKAYALVIDSLIYFGNDETAIDKFLTVRRGEADNIAKTGKLQPTDPQTLASGYVSTGGVAQIANIVGLKLASESTDESEIRSAIAAIIPQQLHGTVTDLTWSAARGEQGYEDTYKIGMPADIAATINDVFKPENAEITSDLVYTALANLPKNTAVVTRYNLKTPWLAWSSVKLIAQKNTDPRYASLISGSSRLIFEPYGISDPDAFFSSLNTEYVGKFQSTNIVTAKLDPDGEESVTFLHHGDYVSMKTALSPDLKPPKQITESGPNIWSTDDQYLQVVFDAMFVKIGSRESLSKLGKINHAELNEIQSASFRQLAACQAPVATVTQDVDIARQIAELIANSSGKKNSSVSTSLTETTFTNDGIERKTTSDFGLIGLIIAQLNED